MTDPQGPFGNHLRFYRDTLKQQPQLLEGLQAVIKDRHHADESMLDRLVSSGLLLETGGAFRPRCGMYAKFFSQ